MQKFKLPAITSLIIVLIFISDYDSDNFVNDILTFLKRMEFWIMHHFNFDRCILLSDVSIIFLVRFKQFYQDKMFNCFE